MEILFLDPVQRACGAGEVLVCAVCLAECQALCLSSKPLCALPLWVQSKSSFTGTKQVRPALVQSRKVAATSNCTVGQWA